VEEVQVEDERVLLFGPRDVEQSAGAVGGE
jgi:hypothetical protein